MSLRYFEIEMPVLVTEVDGSPARVAVGSYGTARRLVVTITMSKEATMQDAVVELGRRIEAICKTHDWTTGWNEKERDDA